MELFKSLKPNIDEISIDTPEIFVPMFRSVEFTLQTIVDKISNIDNLDETEIKNIILRQHAMILNYDLFLKSDESRTQALKLFTNKRFLKIFLDVIGLLSLTREEVVCVNKLAYDYYILPYHDSEVSDYLLRISYQINNILVIRLSGKLGMNGARILSMIANSSFRVEKNVHRTNTFLMRCNLELTLQEIIDIYCILFERVGYLFIHSMLEAKPANLSNEQLKRFDLISIALLMIVDSMPMDDIRKVLLNYAYTLKLLNADCNVRFSLKTAYNFPRILKAIEEVEIDNFENIIVP